MDIDIFSTPGEGINAHTKIVVCDTIKIAFRTSTATATGILMSPDLPVLRLALHSNFRDGTIPIFHHLDFYTPS